MLPVFAAMLLKVTFKYGTRDGKHANIKKQNVKANIPAIFLD